MFRIGEFSKMAKTTIKTLRYYDEIGLLKPQETDRFTGYRMYTTGQLVELHRIQSLRQIGLSVEETMAILAGGSAREILGRRQEELRSEIAGRQDQLSRIAFLLAGKEEERFMNYQAIIKDIPGCIIYSKQFTAPTYNSYFQLIPAIGEQLMARYPDLKCAVPEYCFMVYLDGEYREKDIRVKYCEAVDQMKPDFDDIHFERLEPVTVISVLHKGPYSALPQAYAFLFQWMEENGYTAAGQSRESYIDGIWNKENEEDWLTELQVPIVKKDIR